MERQIYFSERPKAQDWGEKKIIPLNVTDDSSTGGDGIKRGYRADLVKKVRVPVSVESIVEAAIDEEYGEAGQRRIMRKMTDPTDPEVASFTTFVAEIRSAAAAEGYK